MSDRCVYPNCPSGQSVKSSDERHQELRESLADIKKGQSDMIGLMKNSAAQAVEIQNIKEALKDNKAHHDIFFSRLRKVDIMTGGIGAVVVIVEILRAAGVIK